jgi:hypothetical protein
MQVKNALQVGKFTLYKHTNCGTPTSKKRYRVNYHNVLCNPYSVCHGEMYGTIGQGVKNLLL